MLWILESLAEIISERLSRQLHISKENIIQALKDEQFVLPISKEKETKLDPDIYIYDFYNEVEKGIKEVNKQDWKLKNIKLDDGLYYKLDLLTNLIYKINIDSKIDFTKSYTLVGMKNKNNECMNVDELDPIVFKWCYLHSIKV